MEKIVHLTDFIDLEIEIKGQAPEYLLIIPGIGHSFKSYAKLSDQLCKEFTVITINTRGIGNSSKTTTNLSMADLALDIIKLCEHLNIQKFHLLSHSFGGMIAQELYNMSSQNIKSLILVSTQAGMKSKFSTLASKEDLETYREILNLDDPNYCEKALAKVNILFTEDFLLLKNSALLIQKEQKYYRESVKDMQEIQNRRSAGLTYANKNIENIKVPTLILQGALDRLVPEINAVTLNKLIKNSKLRIFENCGHFPFLEKQELFLKVVLSFLNSVHL